MGQLNTLVLTDAGLAALTGHAPPATRLGILFYPKGNPVNPITVTAGSLVQTAAVGTGDDGQPGLITDAVSWSATGTGLPNAVLTPDAGQALTAKIQFAPGEFGTLTVTANAGTLTATGTVNVAEQAATHMSIDFSVVSAAKVPGR